MRIGFIGNFIPAHSTENERAWSFRQLGHEVIEFQENKTTAQELLECARSNDIGMLVYSHTHDPSYVIEGLIDVFKEYKKLGIPTISAHLDRWLGLDRVKDMGKEATWFTEYIFMADASPEAVAKYEELGLNWYWLKPGVVERECFMAEKSPVFPHEIIFVGSKGYHKEYPWREELINWLHETYGDRFAHYGGGGLDTVRGPLLNTLYASAKIVVGDSCFAGETSNYWSDRIPETTGRGGFLIHPFVEGCDHEGVVWHNPKDFKDLKEKIDFYLVNDWKRDSMKYEGFAWTKYNRTYTNLAQQIIDTVCK